MLSHIFYILLSLSFLSHLDSYAHVPSHDCIEYFVPESSPYQVTLSVAPYNSSLAPHKPTLNVQTMSPEQWRMCFLYHGLNEQLILDTAEWYMSDTFIEAVKNHVCYADFIEKHYHTYNQYAQSNGWFDSPSKRALAQRFITLYQDVQQEHYLLSCRQTETHFQSQYAEFKAHIQKEYASYSAAPPGRVPTQEIIRRVAALKDIERTGIRYTQQEYVLPEAMLKHLTASGYDAQPYQACYGNQIQQVIHEDCITLVQATMDIPLTSLMHQHIPAIVDCVDAARDYNQGGECIKACIIQNFCATLLAYGKAVVEGATWGVVGAVQDCIEHPLHTAACVMMPEGVLVYQLSKVLVNVADISVTYAFDAEKGHRKLHEYIAPLTQIIDALQHKQLSGPAIVRGVTQFAVHWKAQSKLLSGLSRFYATTKTNLTKFIKDNPRAAPEQYMTTPDGMVLRASLNNDSKIISNEEHNSLLNVAGKAIKKITAKEAKEVAAVLGFTKTNYYCSGQPIFKKDSLYISVDVDSHSGGFWKMAKSIKELQRKDTRMGTYDRYLKRIGD